MANIVFCGCWPVGDVALSSLIKSHKVSAVFTKSPNPNDKYSSLVWNRAISQKNIDLIDISCNKWPKLLDEYSSCSDLIVSCAFPYIINHSTLQLPSHGGINVHQSLLPRHRGISPIDSALLSGDHKIGFTIHKMTKEVDCGEILAQTTIPIQPHDTKQLIADKMIRLLPEVINFCVDQALSNSQGYLEDIPQDSAPLSKVRIPWDVPVSVLRS